MSCCESVWPFIDPCSSLVTPISASNMVEFINFNVPTAQTLVSIPLTVNKSSPFYIILGDPTLTNTADAVPLIITYQIVNRATSTVNVRLSATADTAHYYLRGLLIVTGA